jgi:hypothetical protein
MIISKMNNDQWVNFYVEVYRAIDNFKVADFWSKYCQR